MRIRDYRLDQQQLAELRAAHRSARDAYRLNAVILLASGWSPTDVAAALLIDTDSARTRYYSGLNGFVNQRDTFTRFFVANSICLIFRGLAANQKWALHHKALIDIEIFDLNSYAYTYLKRYKDGAIDGLVRMNYVGSEALLSPEQLAELDAHLQQHVYLSAEAVARPSPCFSRSRRPIRMRPRSSSTATTPATTGPKR